MTIKQKNALKRWLIIIAILFVVYMVFWYSRSYNYGEDAYSYNSSDMRMSGLDLILYYWYIFQNLYESYAVIVKICYSIILICCCIIVYAILAMIFSTYKRRRIEKKQKKIFDKYYEPFKDICENTNVLSADEIRGMTRYEAKQWSKEEMMIWIAMFLRIRAKQFEHFKDGNLQTCLDVVGIVNFIDKELNYGSRVDKVALMQALIFLRMDVPETSYVNLATDRNPLLRRAAGELYLLLSKNDPYRFLNDKKRGALSLWEMMIAHWTISERRKADKPVPSLIPLLKILQNVHVEASLLRGVGYWGSDSDMESVKNYFDSSEMTLRSAAFDCIKIRSFAPAEEDLKNSFYSQPEYLRPQILNAMVAIKSGKATHFLEEAFNKCVARSTRRSVLYCLWNYGRDGQAAFYRLKAAAIPEERIMFDHIENKLINREA